MVTMDSGQYPIVVSKTSELGALSVPCGFWVVFYTAEDHLRNSSLSLFQKLYGYTLSRLLEIFTEGSYCHVQAFYNGYTHHVPYFGGTTYAYCCHQFKRPFTKAYQLFDRPIIESMAYSSSRVSFWANIKWFFVRKLFPNNCVADTEYILRTHFTWDNTVVCKFKRKYRTIKQIEEAIASGHWGCYRIIVSDRVDT